LTHRAADTMADDAHARFLAHPIHRYLANNVLALVDREEPRALTAEDRSRLEWAAFCYRRCDPRAFASWYAEEGEKLFGDLAATLAALIERALDK